MILVPPTTLDYECSAPIEDYPVWGSGTATEAKVYATPPSGPNRKIWENAVTGDIFITANAKIYVQRAGEGGFSLFVDLTSEVGTGTVYTSTDSIAIDGSYSSNKLFCAWNSDMYVVDQVSGEYDTVSAPSGEQVRSAHANSTNGDIFAICTDASTGAYSIYKMTSTTAWASYAEPSGVDIINDIAIDETSGNVYCVATILPYTQEVYIQTGGTGTFDLDTTSGFSAGFTISVNQVTQDVYTARSSEAYWVKTGGAGDFVEQEITGVSGSMASGAILSSWRTLSLFMLPPGSSDEMYVLSNKAFEAEDYCIYGDSIYYALTFSNFTVPGTDDTKWFYYSPTNPNKMFDDKLLTRTEDPSGALYFTILNIESNIDTIGLFNLSGATSANLRAFGISGLISTTTQTVTSRNISFDSVDDALVYEITLTGLLPSCGGCVAGTAEDIGEELRDVRLELVSYSKYSLDDFGRMTFTRRGRAKRVSYVLWAPVADRDRLYELFNENDATFCMWQGAEILTYGKYERFEMPLGLPSGIKYNLEILGDVDTE